jgi:hypothetical protein
VSLDLFHSLCDIILIKFNLEDRVINKLSIIAAAGLALTGCATMTPEQEAEIERWASRDIVCEGENQCAAMWGAATQFVLDYSDFRVTQATDRAIVTAGPRPDGTQLAYSITRIDLGNGRARFDFRAGCDNMFGCVPSPRVARAGFAKTVIEAGEEISTGPAGVTR